MDGATDSLPPGMRPEPVAASLAVGLGPGHEVLTFAQGNPLVTGMILGNTAEMVITMLLLAFRAGFGVANTELFNVIERTHELGVMGALGMTPRRLAFLVMTESVLASAVGFAVAAVGGYFLIRCLARTGVALGPLAGTGGERGDSGADSPPGR